MIGRILAGVVIGSIVATLVLACAAMNPAGAQPAAAALDALVAAYPAALARHDGVSISWKDGAKMSVSSGRVHKPFKQLLRDASILDQFRIPYARGKLAAPPPHNADPGRFRNEAFFTKMYGNCRKGEVSRKLVSIVWLPKTWGKRILVTSVNGVAGKLQAVSAEIDALPASIKRAAYPIAGTWSCRAVADTGRLSMHSYAAAIDLNTAISDYWFWQGTSDPITYRNRMPQAIVDIFERYGFIWDGKWYHYDTMRFEYRPELLAASRGQ